MVFMYSDKCPCTNKRKNRKDKRRILQFIRAQYKQNS